MGRLLSRRAFLTTAVAAPVIAGLYTWRVEPIWLEITRRDLPLTHLPPALTGKTLVQLSDIHIGPQVDDDYIRRTFAAVTALAPDFVVHTGDLVTYTGPAVIEQAKPLMAGFPRGKLGTVAVLGNHDYGSEWMDAQVAAQVAGLFTANGAQVLRNATALLGGLQFAGCDDLWSPYFSPAPALRALQSSEPALVLCHNPDACDLDVWAGYQGWILAGHTHGGQCKPPFLPPPLLPVRNRRYTAGAFELSGGRHLYISRGIGHLQRVRFNVRPEVTLFTLRPA